MLRTFYLDRKQDCSGVSGCGKVCEGVLFVESGEAILHWFGEHPSINIYRSLTDLELIHGHDGSTKIVFDDESKKTN